jgi:NTP pyrophosphatase (non-canonical NTP hydrolase)
MIENFNDFVKQALRTESVPTTIKTNKKLIMQLFQLQIITGEMLDCMKKEIFYNKSQKFDEKFPDLLLKAQQSLLDISLCYMKAKDGSLEKQDLDHVRTRFFHGVIGKATEIAELSSVLLKHIEDPNYEIDVVNVQEELADDKWYDGVIIDDLNIDFYKALDNVIRKLRIRFPEKFDEHLADNRNLVEERKALEQ